MRCTCHGGRYHFNGTLFAMDEGYAPAVQHMRYVAARHVLPLLDMARVPELDASSTQRARYIEPEGCEKLGCKVWLHPSPSGTQLWYERFQQLATAHDLAPPSVA